MSLALRPHRFTRTTSTQFGVNSYAGFTSPSGATVYGNGLQLSYTLAQINMNGTANSFVLAVPDYTEFSALFDQYRIVGVKERWIWSNNIGNSSAAVGTLTGNAIPIVQSCFDYNDAVPPATNVVLQEREDTRYLTFDSTGPKTFSVKPKQIGALSVGGATASLAGQTVDWVNTSSPTVIHLGHKMYMESQSNAATQLQTGYLWVYITLEFEFRTPQ
jgi:hypothetical protein